MARLSNPFRGVRASDERHRVTTFELFFDLVFVFAFTQVTALMAQEHDAQGVLRGLVILTLLWWSWVAYSWLANQTHVDEGIVRIGMAVAMAAMFVVALTIPEAFDDLEGGLSGPLVLAVAYFVVRLTHIVLYLIAAGDDRDLRRQVLRTSWAFLTGTTLIVVGAVVGGPLQIWFWIAGLVADLTLTYLTSTGGSWRLHSPRHWAERYGLVVILALGESIVAIGVGAAQLPISVPILIGALLGIALSVGLWWLYFDVIALAAEHALKKTTGIVRVTLATDAYTYLHLLIIMGVILSALGVEQVIAHLDDAEMGWFAAIALFGGTSLYLAGHGLFWRRTRGQWDAVRFAFATLLLALIPFGVILSPLGGLGLVVFVVLALVVIETTRNGEFRAHVRAREPEDEPA